MAAVRYGPPPARCGVMLATCLLLAGCFDAKQQETTAKDVAGGDAAKGAELIRAYGCGACHTVPGIAGADGLVGPPLTMMARRVYIAGVLRNTPDNMMLWLQSPQRIVPGNVMPDMGITGPQARDVAAYLYSLR